MDSPRQPVHKQEVRRIRETLVLEMFRDNGRKNLKGKFPIQKRTYNSLEKELKRFRPIQGMYERGW